jgi:phage I-like protein
MDNTNDNLNTDETAMLEIYLSSDAEAKASDDGLVWKEVLREGEWSYRPGAGHKPMEKPLRMVAGYSSNPAEEIGFADLIDAFNDGAMDHVTIPTSHADQPHENTGFVRELEIRQDEDGTSRLYAGFEFTEPDIKEKALRGTIANTSVGVIFDYVKKSSGKVYKMALGHIALTNKPWIDGMKPFGIAASEDVPENEIVSVVIDESKVEEINEVIDNLKIDNTEDFNRAKDIIIQSATQTGNIEWLPAEWRTVTTTNTSNVSEETDSTDDESVSLDASDKNNEVNKGEKMSETSDNQEVEGRLEGEAGTTDDANLSEDITKLSEKVDLAENTISEKESRIAELERKLRASSVKERIQELKEIGFSEYPGMLKKIEELYLADEGSAVATLTLSEDGKDTEVELSVTDIVNTIVDSMPKDDSEKLAFSDQASQFDDHGRRESNSDDLDPVESAAKAAEELGMDFPKVGDN